MADNRKKKDKWKKDPNSPDFQNIQPEQNKMDMDGRSQPQASAGFVYPSYTQAHPQQNAPYGQPYYGSPPNHLVSLSQLPPLPVSPQGQNVLSGDVVTKLFERLEMMDKTLGQLHSIQSALQNVTVQMNDVRTRLKTMGTKVGDLERSREFDSKTLEEIQGKQREIDNTLKKMQKLEEEPYWLAEPANAG